jgi:nucleoid-associated protein YgaU
VRTRTLPISNLTEPDAITHAPPRLLLLWGSLAFPCFLISVRQQFEYFSASGQPQRARLTVEFKGHDLVETLLAAAPVAQIEQASRYVAKIGDTLQGVAVRVYKDPTRWREIAQANNIDNPRSLASGVRLQIPRLG